MKKNNKQISLDLNDFEDLILSSSKYYFPIELYNDELSIMAKNTDNNLVKWFSIKKIDDFYTATIYGNTDNLNIWLYDTRKDLTPDNIIDFIKSVNKSTLKVGIKLPLKNLIDPEDWQEIANVRDAYLDDLYIMNPEELIDINQKKYNNMEKVNEL